jgi:hypothetical protein
MLESGSSGSVRGVLSNEHSYREPGPITEVAPASFKIDYAATLKVDAVILYNLVTAHRAVGRIPFNPPSRMDRRIKQNPPYAS